MTATKFKFPYEPPKILDLGGGVAYAAQHCMPGSVSGGQCKAGGSPQKKCQAGSVAYGGFCTAGSVAGAKCTSGNVPQK
ncbi:MAG: hypothetical protein U9R02_16330 [Thermodesulfobacteriota bacterium]|nr:hypothetical protein [Thermodesulfobacteriota bacterium]